MAKKITEERDRPLKSIIKTITWRIIASFTTFLLAYYFFRDDPAAKEKATAIAVAESFIKMILYFLHERAWNSVKWGKMRISFLKYNIFKRKVINKTNI